MAGTYRVSAAVPLADTGATGSCGVHTRVQLQMFTDQLGNNLQNTETGVVSTTARVGYEFVSSGAGTITLSAQADAATTAMTGGGGFVSIIRLA